MVIGRRRARRPDEVINQRFRRHLLDVEAGLLDDVVAVCAPTPNGHLALPPLIDPPRGAFPSAINPPAHPTLCDRELFGGVIDHRVRGAVRLHEVDPHVRTVAYRLRNEVVKKVVRAGVSQRHPMTARTLGVGAVHRTGYIASPPLGLVERHGGMQSNLLENSSDFEAVENFESAAASRWGAKEVEELISVVDALELAENIGERG